MAGDSPKTEKEDLQQEFLFNIKRKSLDICATSKQCQTTLSITEDSLFSTIKNSKL